jgi:chaperonin GroES
MIKPLGNRIMVKPKAPEEKKGNIFLPQSAQEKPYEGTVVAIGDGKLDSNGNKIPLSISVGDKIIYGKYSGGAEIKVDGEEYILMSEDDVYAITNYKEEKKNVEIN